MNTNKYVLLKDILDILNKDIQDLEKEKHYIKPAYETDNQFSSTTSERAYNSACYEIKELECMKKKMIDLSFSSTS
jgi:hypothetical protein